MMIRKRGGRTTIWLAAIAGLVTALATVPMPDRAAGTFIIRPVTRAELRAPVAGFLQQVYYDQGDNVSAGAMIAPANQLRKQPAKLPVVDHSFRHRDSCVFQLESVDQAGWVLFVERYAGHPEPPAAG